MAIIRAIERQFHTYIIDIASRKIENGVQEIENKQIIIAARTSTFLKEVTKINHLGTCQLNSFQ